MNKYLAAAQTILATEPAGLHYEEITRRALDRGLVTTSGKTPEASMNAQLAMSIKRDGLSSKFRRVKAGIYALTAGAAVAPARKDPQARAALPDEDAIESAYTGKGGEHAVTAELLFRGFNASIMSVDTGMDIVATKGDRLFNVQVKTSNLNKFATYVFDIRVSSFERHNSSSTFYVFVLRDDERRDFLVVPFFELAKKIHERAVRTVNDGTRYRVNIKVREGRVTIGTRDHDVTYYLNNWAVLN